MQPSGKSPEPDLARPALFLGTHALARRLARRRAQQKCVHGMAINVVWQHHRRMPRTHVFCGVSLDGFIAGPHDELDWLTGGDGTSDVEVPETFAPFYAGIGAVLMGRRTYDIVAGMDEWFYGDTPMLVATSRALSATRPSVRAIGGSVESMIEEAKRSAGDCDVYVDGGRLIRAALDAGLIDEITTTIVPIIIGQGIPLFAGVTRHHRLELLGERAVGAGVELRYRVKR